MVESFESLDYILCDWANPILYQVYEWSYLGQFAAQAIETWQTNSFTGNAPIATKNSVLKLTYLYASSCI